MDSALSLAEMTVMFCRLREFNNTIQVYMIKHLSIVGKVLVPVVVMVQNISIMKNIHTQVLKETNGVTLHQK